MAVRRSWYRIDAAAPERWDWRAYPTPRSRFDSASGTVRVRYAADAARAAMRERFDREGRHVTRMHLELQLVELTGAVRVLDLRRDQTLDALGLDDQISTSRAYDVWQASQRLVDLVHGWFGESCDGVVYRSRTTPQRSANLAFFQHAPLQARSLGALRDQDDLLLRCTAHEGFTIQGRR